MARRRTFNINIISQKKSPIKFSGIDFGLFVNRDDGVVYVENYITDTAHAVSIYDLHHYVKISTINTNWSQLTTGNYIRYVNNELLEKTLIGSGRCNINIRFKQNIPNLCPLFTFLENNDPLYNPSLFSVDDFNTIQVNVPIFDLYGIFRTPINKNTESDEKQIVKHFSHIQMKINDKFYHFPYGNVHRSNKICMISNKYKFDYINAAYYSWITSIFNNDLGFIFKYSDSKYIFNKFKTLSEIMETINNGEIFSFIEFLYYVSHINENDLNYNIFMEITKDELSK